MSFQISEFFVGDPNSIYVQLWKAVTSAPYRGSAILVHGGGHTGVCWTSCPDGRPGWAQRLATQGYSTYVIDWPGLGRSPRMNDFLTCGPGPAIAALNALMRQIGPSLIVGHSMGAALALKAVDNAPDLATGFLAVTPAPPALFEAPQPMAPEDRPIVVSEEIARAVLTYSPQFPAHAFDQYFRSLVDSNPSIWNAIAGKKPSPELIIHNRDRLRNIPSLVLAADDDRLVPEKVSLMLADYIGAQHAVVGRDWGLEGHGHMMPVELGTEKILDRALSLLGQ